MDGRETPELIMTVGLPRSGKTTWSKEQGLPMVNPDSIRLALHGQAFRREAEPMVWATAKLMVAALFLAGHRAVILDATNVTRKSRDEWKDDRWRRRFVEFGTLAPECCQRAGDNPELVTVINRMADRQEPVGVEELEM